MTARILMFLLIWCCMRHIETLRMTSDNHRICMHPLPTHSAITSQYLALGGRRAWTHRTAQREMGETLKTYYLHHQAGAANSSQVIGQEHWSAGGHDETHLQIELLSPLHRQHLDAACGGQLRRDVIMCLLVDPQAHILGICMQQNCLQQ